MRTQLIVIMLVAVVLILMTVQNPNPVSLQFLSWQTHAIPQIVVILVSLMGGMVLSTILGLSKQAKLKETIRRLEEDMEELTEHGRILPDDEIDL